jgi:ABC-type glycerol-3-phosphate transport system substrate-binding protein
VLDLNHKHAVTPGEGAAQTIAQGDTWANFQAGVVGMVVMYIVAPTWITERGQKPLKFPIKFAPFPRAAAGKNYYTTWNHNEVGMTSSCKNKEAAWVFLKFFGSEDGGMVWLNSTFFHVVPNKSLMQTDWYRNRVPGFDASVCLEMMAPEMFVGRPEPLEVFKFNDIAGEELSAIRLKKKSLSEGLGTIKDKVEPILAQTEV